MPLSVFRLSVVLLLFCNDDVIGFCPDGCVCPSEIQVIIPSLISRKPGCCCFERPCSLIVVVFMWCVEQ